MVADASRCVVAAADVSHTNSKVDMRGISAVKDITAENTVAVSVKNCPSPKARKRLPYTYGDHVLSSAGTNIRIWLLIHTFRGVKFSTSSQNVWQLKCFRVLRNVHLALIMGNKTGVYSMIADASSCVTQANGEVDMSGSSAEKAITAECSVAVSVKKCPSPKAKKRLFTGENDALPSTGKQINYSLMFLHMICYVC
jgi:hypothetical protein